MAGKQADINVGVITNYQDKGLKQAQTGLSGFKQSVADADGAGNKLKAGFSSVTDSIKANAGLMAVGAGAALVAFGVKAVGAFTGVAKSALDLSTATGLNVEQASRWIAVGDDFEVSAEALQTGLGKIAKTMDDTKWADYGIATRDAGGAARDTNDILLDSFDMLSKVKNETERARIGQELFGKGYQSLTPILGKTRAEYEKMLGAVEDGQVITGQEAEKAEKMRLAQDDLSDAIEEVTLAVGELIAEGAPVVSFFAKAVLKTIEWKDALEDLDGQLGGSGLFSSLPSLFGKIGQSAVDVKDRFVEMKEHGPFSTDEQQKAEEWADTISGLVVPNINDLDLAHKALADGGLARTTTAEEDLERATDDANIAQQEYKRQSDATSRAVKQNIDEMIGKWDELTGDVEDDRSWLTLQGQFDELRVKAEEAFTAAATGADDAETKGRDYQIAVDDLILSTINYGKEVADLPVQKVTLIKAAIDAGDIDRAEAMLAILTRNREINIDLIGKGAAGYGPLKGAQASGGPVTKGNWLVGEQGPEIVHMNGNGNVSNARDTAKMLNGNGNGGGGNTYNVTLAMPVIASQADYYRAGQTITAAIAEFERRRGF